ncbi:MAG: hypothetical protein COA78_32150 [Blastopirellula sp.]|nr:MAG: hypothetical protein COA78_32150 [Blastopirellula sp.]
MLVEINCDMFRQKSIKFTEGLNVVLGDSKATNSIGKSSLLMVIDFVFGGTGLYKVNDDIAEELGDHNYYFKFTFDEQSFFFRRGINSPDLIYQCDEKYNEKEPIGIGDYTDWLSGIYELKTESSTFRSNVGLYSRIWGKDNLDVKRPLHPHKNEKATKVSNDLLKTLGYYSDIEQLAEKVKSKADENSVINKAIQQELIPKINKTAYRNNEKSIVNARDEMDDIALNLSKYAISINELANKEVWNFKRQKEELLAIKLDLESRISRLKNNINNGKYIKSKSLEGLVDYFPDVNVKKIIEVEEFHQGISKILRKEMRKKEKELSKQLEPIDEELAKMGSSGVESPDLIVDRIYNATNELRKAEQENEYYDRKDNVTKELRESKVMLSDKRTGVLRFVSEIINDKIRMIVNQMYNVHRKSPSISFTDTNYAFEIQNDKGTGKAYSNLLVFDLAVFSLSPLPFIIHDSLLFKNVETDAVANLIDIYESFQKQSFIAIDMISIYGEEAEAKLLKKRVIQLDDDNVLYTKDWRD